MGVITRTVPGRHTILDCGAALDCVGEVAAAWTPSPRLDKIQSFKFGGGADPVEALLPVTLPIHIGDTKTLIEAFVVPRHTPHLMSRRWLSQHRCVVNCDPMNLCLESPEFGTVLLCFTHLVTCFCHLRICRTLWVSCHVRLSDFSSGLVSFFSNAMNKQRMRCSRETRSLTNELRRELQIQQSVAGVVFLT